MPDWLLPNRAYDVLKWLALIVLPAIGVLVQTLAPYGAGRGPIRPRRPSTPSPLAIGVVIGASTLKAKASKTE